MRKLLVSLIGLLFLSISIQGQQHKFANHAVTTLASGITNSATSLTVTTGEGARFPEVTGTDFFFAILEEGTPITAREWVLVTAHTAASDTFTIVRGQQGTSGTAFNAGAKFEMRLSAETLADFVQNPTTSKGDIMVADATGIINRLPVAAVNGQLLRSNSGATLGIDYAPGPNVSTLSADTVSSSNTVFTNLTDLAGVPGAADKVVMVECTFVYRTVALTTGITLGYTSNNASVTAPPQWISGAVNVYGFATAGGGGAWNGVFSTNSGFATTSAVVAANTDYIAKLYVMYRSHLTDATIFGYPIFRSEINASAATLKKGSVCVTWVVQ